MFIEIRRGMLSHLRASRDDAARAVRDFELELVADGRAA